MSRLTQLEMHHRRERYRRAAEMSKVRGKFSCLVINVRILFPIVSHTVLLHPRIRAASSDDCIEVQDLDAGIGIFKDTQVTVNNQVRGCLRSFYQRLQCAF